MILATLFPYFLQPAIHRIDFLFATSIFGLVYQIDESNTVRHSTTLEHSFHTIDISFHFISFHFISFHFI